MTRKKVWSPADGPEAAPQQIPHRTGHVSGGGDDDRRTGLWAPTEGPVRSDPGGPGGEPDGKTIPRPGRTALDEDERSWARAGAARPPTDGKPSRF